MNLHPLLTDGKNKHYNVQGMERTSLQFLEDKMTVAEMIGACKFNILKYLLREKGSNIEDAAKSEKYNAYRAELEKSQVKDRGIIVSDYWKLVNVQWDYQN